MREIKFRAWDKEASQMRSVLNLFANQHVYVNCQCSGEERLKFHSDRNHHNLSHHISSKNCHLMQYTGLKDKNGMEIYEGDVVEFELQEEPNKKALRLSGRIDFQNWGWLILYTYRGAEDSEFVHLADFVTVIGNIYQNPKLLTA